MNHVPDDIKSVIKNIYPSFDLDYSVSEISFELNTEFFSSNEELEIGKTYELCSVTVNSSVNDATQKESDQLKDLINVNMLREFSHIYPQLVYPELAKEVVEEVETFIKILEEIEDPEKIKENKSEYEFFKKINYVIGENLFTSYQNSYETAEINGLKKIGKSNQEVKQLFLDYSKAKIIKYLVKTPDDRHSVLFDFFDVYVDKLQLAKGKYTIKSKPYRKSIIKNFKGHLKYYYYVFYIDEVVAEKYPDLFPENTREDYQAFFSQAIKNTFDKWGLINNPSPNQSYSQDYIDVNAIIQLTARDMTESKNLPNHSVFSTLSSTPYEGEYLNNGGIVFPKISDCQELMIPFKHEVEITNENIRYIRKLLEMTNTSYYLVGLRDKILGISTFQQLSCAYKINFKGFMKWSLDYCDEEMKSHTVFHYDESNYLCDIENNQNILKKLETLFDPQIASKIENIIKACFEQKHGAMIIIYMNELDAESEMMRLKSKDRCLLFEEPLNLDSSPELILNLSAIDGAVAIDINGKCYGCGVILDGEAVIKGTPKRGARYNSGKNYVKWTKDRPERHGVNGGEMKKLECLALIISEDGNINLLDYDSIENEE